MTTVCAPWVPLFKSNLDLLLQRNVLKSNGKMHYIRFSEGVNMTLNRLQELRFDVVGVAPTAIILLIIGSIEIKKFFSEKIQ